jgi:hypothetical protein
MPSKPKPAVGTKKTAKRAPTSRKPAGGAVNPPHGEKGSFLKITVTLDPATYELIATEAMRRKMNREKDAQLSAVIREAVAEYLAKR